MTEREVTEFIVDIENRYPVSDWRIDGVHIWPCVRIKIGQCLFRDTLVDSQVLKNKKKSSMYFDYFKLIIKMMRHMLQGYFGELSSNNVVNRADVVMLTYNAARIQYMPDRRAWYDYICEPIEDLLDGEGLKVFNLELISDDIEKKFPRYNKTTLISHRLLWIDIEYKLRKMVGGSFSNIEINLKEYDRFLRFVKKNGIDCDEILPDKLVYVVNKIKRLESFYSVFLDDTKAKCVCVPDWRTMNAYALALAAFNRNMPCIELQHGYYGEECYTHCRWTKIPPEGYEIMPSHYWCWTEKSAESINKCDNHGHAIGGFPQISLFWHDMSNVVVQEYRKLAEKKYGRMKKIILISLQNVYPKNMYPDWLIDFVKENQNEYFWVLRKHISREKSGQDEICEELENLPNVEWREGTRFPLLLLLQYVKVNVTLTSSVVVEAMMEGVPSIILNMDGHIRYKEQEEAGYARFVTNKEDFTYTLQEWTTAFSHSKRGEDDRKASEELVKIIKNGKR